MPTECGNRSHSAAFPFALAEWFIKLFTAKGDVVLDPFLGSGTTAIASAQMERQYIGIDIKKEYCEMTENALSEKFKQAVLL